MFPTFGEAPYAMNARQNIFVSSFYCTKVYWAFVSKNTSLVPPIRMFFVFSFWELRASINSRDFSTLLDCFYADPSGSCPILIWEPFYSHLAAVQFSLGRFLVCRKEAREGASVAE